MEEWRKRLIEAVDRDPRSDRAISLATGQGENAVNELRNTSKKPSVVKVLTIAKAVNLSITELFLGLDITPAEEEFLALMAKVDPEVRGSILTLLRSGQRPQAR